MDKALTPQQRLDLRRANESKQAETAGGKALREAHEAAMKEKVEREDPRAEKPAPLPRADRKARAADAETGG